MAHTRPLRIGHVIWGTEREGIRRSLLNLARHIDKDRFHLCCIASRAGKMFDELRELGLPGRTLEFTAPRLHLKDTEVRDDGLSPRHLLTLVSWAPRVIVRLIRAVRRMRLDVLHSHNYLLDIMCGIAGAVCGVPVIWHLRGMANPKSLHGLALRVFDVSAACLSSRIIAVSNAVRDVLRPAARRKTVVVYNSVPVLQTRDAQVDRTVWRQWGLREQDPVIGLVARIDENKGQIFFMQVAQRVLQKFPAAQFVIVGDVPPGQDAYRAHVMAECERMGLKDSVTFTGHYPNASRLNGALDVVTFCTQFAEGLPNAVAEAMAASKPVVGTAVGGAKELVVDGETGFLLQPTDVKGFADRVLQFLADRQLGRKMGEAAYRRALDLIDLEPMIQRIEAVYDSVARRGSPSRPG